MSDGVVVYGNSAPPVLTGSETALHKLVNVLRDLVVHSAAFKTEGEQHAALTALTDYEKAVHGTEKLAALALPTDRAHHEDVSKRRSLDPAVANLPVGVPGTGPLDYDKLAEALVRAQQGRSAVSGEVIQNDSGSGEGL